MSGHFTFYCYFCFLLVVSLFHSRVSNQKVDNDVLCMEGERQALLLFKQGLIDKTDRLASWVGEDRNCCRWTGIVCDNITGHVHGIHLDGNSPDLYRFCDPTRQLGGNLSSSLLHLKQLRHLDLSCNDFVGMQIPEFIGSLGNLRYLNLSSSRFSGIIPPQLGNLSQLHVLSLGIFSKRSESTRMINMQWLSNLRLLHHLEMSTVNLSKAINWFQVINTLTSLTELHLSSCDLMDVHPHVTSLNITSLFLLDISHNSFSSVVPQWIFSLTNLVSMDLTQCYFHSLIHDSIGSFHNLTSLKLLHVSSNTFMNSSIVLKGLSSNMVSLQIGSCGVSSSVLNSLLNLTSILSLDLKGNKLTKKIPKSLGNICNLEEIDLSFNDFDNASLNYILGSFIECESLIGRSSSLVHLDISDNRLDGNLPDSLGNLSKLERLRFSNNLLTGKLPDSLGNLSKLKQLSFFNNLLTGKLPDSLGNLSKLEQLSFFNNLLTGKLPDSLGNLSKLEQLSFFNNLLTRKLPDSLGNLSKLEQLSFFNNLLTGKLPDSLGNLTKLEQLSFFNNLLTGKLPDSLGNLSKLEVLRFSNNLLTGVVTEAYFAKLASLYILDGEGNNLTLRPQLANWIPPFQLEYLDLSSWNLGPQFPLWLQSQTHLRTLNIRNTGISSAMPVSFLKSFPNLTSLDMSHNHIQGTLLDIPATVTVLDLNSNEFTGELPKLSNGSFIQILDLSSNFFVGSIHRLLCSNSVKKDEYPLAYALNLGNNHLSGVIPECWDKWSELEYLNLGKNRFSGDIPETLASLRRLESLSMHGNKLSGRIPDSLMNLKDLKILQIVRNELVGSIPKWFGNLSYLRILNLRSNNFVGNIPYELCYSTHIQILDLAHNDLSGNIPRCFNNFSVISGKEVVSGNDIIFAYISSKAISGTDSLVMKGREDTYDTILGLVMLLDLSSNKLDGHIPSELMALRELKSLNLSGNQLTGSIPEKIGDMKSLETLDVSLNKLSGTLPMSLSNLTFLLSFNVSCNQLTGRVPSSTQLRSFSQSSFFGNKLCGDPLTDRCIPTEVPNAEVQKQDDVSHEVDWGLITSIVVGLVVGFWLIVVPLMVSRAWRIVYFRFLNELSYMVYDVMRKYGLWKQHAV